MKLRLSVRFWSALIALALRQDIAFPQAPARLQNAETPVRGDRILIKPKPDLAAHLITNLHAAEHSRVLRTWPRLGGVQLLQVPPGETPHGLVQKYQRSGLVEYAEPDRMIQLAAVPNDPHYADGSLWGLDNTGQNAGLPDADIDATEAWNVIFSASNIVVAVVDTGVRYTHEDLAANMWTSGQDGSHGINVLAGNNDPADDSGHGSRLAGIIGAVGSNLLGVVGVAWRVQIMACRFAGNQGGSISDAISCIEFAQTNGASIINASWGLYEYSPSLSNAIYASREAGIVVVAAAGNNGLDNDLNPYYPASLDLDNIISVAATTRRDDLYPLSNTGATSVDIAAPGLEILSTDYAANNAYAMDEGTSMAAAYVSGACALLRARHPADSAAQIIQRLVSSADKLPGLAGACVSEGRLNLRRALGQPEQVPLRLIARRSTTATTVDVLVCGEALRSYVIEATTNQLLWTGVFTNTTSGDGSYVFTDGSSPYLARRFYRARSSP